MSISRVKVKVWQKAPSLRLNYERLGQHILGIHSGLICCCFAQQQWKISSLCFATSSGDSYDALCGAVLSSLGGVTPP